MSDLPARLSVVTLGARDLPELRRFYRALGWEEVPASGDGWAAFLLGGVLLALYPVEELATEAADGAPGPVGWSGITLACNVDGPEQVDSAFAAAVRAGATVVAEPVERPWGGRSAYVADPEGNRWEIAWASAARFDGRGALTGFDG
ncbi:VOC family protein [Nocardiopsis dassonvillei]|uniref:VOC family protein n=1 Tax=Nocardiopsis dassonvillei TaxID=2014 RepID=UPI00366F90E4